MRFFAILCALVSAGCWRDGVVDQDGDEGLAPLALFRGKAVEADSGQTGAGLTTKMVLRNRNPRVAIVWQFTGVRSYKDTYAQSVTRADLPFAFSGSILMPPPKDFFEADEVAIGSVWLYSDANGNGSLDRIIHPEMQAKNRIVDSLAALAAGLKKEVAELSILRSQADNSTDTYWLGRFGTVIAPSGTGRDTLWAGKSEAEKDYWSAYLGSRHRILAAITGWERFFALRKKLADRKIILKATPEFAYEVEYHHKRRRYPMPGKEREFETALRKATLAEMQLVLFHEANQRLAYEKGWVEYPYTGIDEEGTDWVFGRSRRYHILYFESRAALDEFLEGERSSSFRVDGLERFHAGYNLAHCDEQYRCEAVSWKEEIDVELGWSETYFNPPSVPIRKPVENPPLAESVSFDAIGLEGTYDYLSYRPVSIVADGKRLWAEIPDFGLARLEPYDSTRFYSPIGEVQAEFRPGSGEWPRKLILYFRNTTAAAVRDTGERFRGDFARARAEVDSLRDAIADSKPYAGGLRGAYRFDYRKDTLAVEFPSDSEGDPVLRMPGISAHAMLAAGDSDFISPAGDIRISLRGMSEGVTHALLIRQGKESLLPRFGHAPGVPSDTAAGSAQDTLFASGGDRSFPSPGIDGRPRFGCAGDGLFAVPGAGWLDGAAPSDTSDPVPFRSGGQTVVWKVQGAAGKSAALGMRICSEQAGFKGRMLVEFRGGADPSRLTKSLGGPFWAEFQAGEGRIATGAVDIPDGTYYIGLVTITTADDPFRFAIDGYWIRGN